MIRACIVAGLAAALIGASACAPKPPAHTDGFLVTREVEIGAAPHVVYATIGKVDRWWDGQHTWSGSAKNLSLDLQAGGCFCERWESSSVEHARVVSAMPGALVRLEGAFGPLQEMAVSGSLSFVLKAEGTGTLLTMTYRVSGDSQHELDRFESAVAGVLGAQIERLKRLLETGSPD